MSDGRPRDCEVAVIGGGIAGSSLAAGLARAGRSVVLLEKDSFPREKLCGEFLSPECQGHFAALGCLETLEALGPSRLVEARLFAPNGRRAVLALDGEGWGLSRRALDAALFRHAADSGARAFAASPVTAIEAAPGGATLEVGGAAAPWRLSARLAVLAHGRRGALDHALERPFLQERHPYLGLKRHHRPAWSAAGARLRAELKGGVELHFFAGGYCGLSFVEGGLVNACLLLHRSFLERLGSTRWEAVARAASALSPTLAERLSGLEPAEEAAHAVAAIPFEPKEASAAGLLFVGDAAGMIAPLCGSGQAFALAGAGSLARELSLGLGPESARRWERLWKSRFAPRVRRGRRLQQWALRPWAASALVAGVRLFPGLGRRMLAATRAG